MLVLAHFNSKQKVVQTQVEKSLVHGVHEGTWIWIEVSLAVLSLKQNKEPSLA